MKNRKEKIEKIILSVLTFLLIIYISFGFVFFSVFNISKKFLNKDNISDFISNISIIDVLKQELGSNIKEIKLMEKELKNIGITSEGINSFMNSEDVREFSMDMMTNIFDGIVNNNYQEYQVNIEDINVLVDNNIDKLQVNSSFTESQILDKLNSKLPSLVSNINNLINNLCEKLENSEIFTKYQNYINVSIGVFDIIYSDIVYFLIILILISFITLLIFIRRSVYKSLKWLSISFIIPGTLLFILSFFINNYINVDSILINDIISVIANDLNEYSLIYILISIIIIIINLITYFIKKKQKLKNDN